MPGGPPSAGLVSTTYGDAGPRLALLHGLFGQGRNFTQVAKVLAAEARVNLVDLPDHGRSAWSGSFSYSAMAAAVVDHLAALAPGERWVVAGHSMGGKVAMLVALQHPTLLAGLCVVDVAPVPTAAVSTFSTYVEALRSLDLATLSDRATADRLVAARVPDASVRGFLLQNLRRDGTGAAARWRWQMNLDLLGDSLPAIADWPVEQVTPYEGPVLWLAGAESAYVQAAFVPAMRSLFPRVRLVTVKKAGHWVHADQPEVFVTALRRFLVSATS